MATTLLPIDPETTPQRVSRILTISANLLPDEVVAVRHARRARGVAAVALLIVAAMCATWWVVAFRDKQDAAADVKAAEHTVTELRRSQSTYSEAARVRNDRDELRNQLKAVMADDLDWGALLTMLRRTGATVGVQIDGVNGKLAGAEDNGAAPAGALPGADPASVAGSLVVTGYGKDKKAVAAYADALKKQGLVANPYVTNVADGNGQAEFSLTLDITGTALCGRFTTPCKASGGK